MIVLLLSLKTQKARSHERAFFLFLAPRPGLEPGTYGL